MSTADGILREGIHQIPLADIYAVEQVRQHFSEARLQELADDMKASGQAQAIMVRPKPSENGKYLIVFGERRVRAARLLGWDTIRAEVRDIDDLEAARLQYSENQARVDLNPIDDARAIRRRMDAEGWTTFVQAATGLGRKENTIRERVKLLDLIEPMQDMLEKEQVGVSFGVAMQKLNPAMQQLAVKYLRSVSRVDIKTFQQYCDKLYMAQEQPTLFPLEEFEQGLPSKYSSGPQGGDVSSTESVPQYQRHPYLPEIPRARNVGTMLEKYIEQLRNDPDYVRREAANVVEHIYVELREAKKIKD
jgi:ParB family transcriptional regulator, chromosome partitioning protein